MHVIAAQKKYAWILILSKKSNDLKTNRHLWDKVLKSTLTS